MKSCDLITVSCDFMIQLLYTLYILFYRESEEPGSPAGSLERPSSPRFPIGMVCLYKI